MDTLVDTNILLRSADPAHPQHEEAIAAANSLRSRGDCLVLAPQNLVEFRAVATRPRGANGLGMHQSQVNNEIARPDALFRVLPEGPSILAEWEILVRSYGAQGKQNHDAWIVAIMRVHGVRRILAFNKCDFVPYGNIDVLTPSETLALPNE